MNETELRTALAQTLENYQRCGLRRIPHDTNLLSAASQTIQAWRENSLTSGDILGELSQEQVTGSGQPYPGGNTDIANRATQPSTSTSTSTPPPNASQGNVTSENAVQRAEKDSPELPRAPQATGDSVAAEPLSAAQVWLNDDLSDNTRQESFRQLDEKIKACRLCTEICCHRQQTVFGAGPLRPRVCFMGEAPGADEDRMGQPFVGQAGQLLTKIITAMQLRREDVYILNALKCRPPSNRTPSDLEIANCRPFVETQLATLRPQFIVCLGAVAVRSLLKDNTTIGRLRGRFFQYQGAKVVVTYHPAYLLRNDQAKRLVWEDMQMLMAELGIRVAGKA